MIRVSKKAFLSQNYKLTYYFMSNNLISMLYILCCIEKMIKTILYFVFICVVLLLNKIEKVTYVSTQLIELKLVQKEKLSH